MDRPTPKFRDIPPNQPDDPQTTQRAPFAPKTPPFSVRMVGGIGTLCMVIGLMAGVFGFLVSFKEGGGAGFMLGMSGVGAFVGGALYLAAYHVAIAILDLRDKAFHDGQ